MISIIETHGYGKTTKLLYMSAASGKHIITYSNESADRLTRDAHKLNLHIPKVISIANFTDQAKIDHNIQTHGILIDDLDKCMQTILGPIELVAYTLTPVEYEEYE